MKIGLFFGSFNPIHIGHIIIVNHLLAYSDLNEVWFVVTPHNPHKNKATLLADYQRLHLVRLAIEDYPKMRVSDVEFGLEKPSYTIDSLTVLSEKHPNHKFSLILGMDNLENFDKWKNHTEILKKYKLLIYPRQGSKMPEKWHNNEQINITDAPIIQISATYIRKLIKDGKGFKPLLPERVFSYLDGSNFYK